MYFHRLRGHRIVSSPGLASSVSALPSPFNRSRITINNSLAAPRDWTINPRPSTRDRTSSPRELLAERRGATRRASVRPSVNLSVQSALLSQVRTNCSATNHSRCDTTRKRGPRSLSVSRLILSGVSPKNSARTSESRDTRTRTRARIRGALSGPLLSIVGTNENTGRIAEQREKR